MHVALSVSVLADCINDWDAIMQFKQVIWQFARAHMLVCLFHHCKLCVGSHSTTCTFSEDGNKARVDRAKTA